MKEHIAEPLHSGNQIVYGDEKYIYLSKLYKYIPSYYLFSLKVLCHVCIGILTKYEVASISLKIQCHWYDWWLGPFNPLHHPTPFWPSPRASKHFDTPSIRTWNCVANFMSKVAAAEHNRLWRESIEWSRSYRIQFALRSNF